VEMLKFLIKKGFEYNRENIDGERPIDLVANVKNSKIYRKLEKLLNIKDK
jgi:ankyrin repeat protein